MPRSSAPARPVSLFFLPLLAIAALAAPAARGQTVTEYSHHVPPGYAAGNERFGIFPVSFFGPRTEWARPAAAGRLNLLVFAHHAAARDAVELASRIDAQVDVVATSGNQPPFVWSTDRGGSDEGFYASVGPRQALDDRVGMLLSPAYRHDAIVVGRLLWPTIPEPFRQQILAKVKAGTGLVLLSPQQLEASLEEALKTAAAPGLAATIRGTVPLSILPLEVKLEPPAGRGKPRTIGPFEVKAARLGEGRIAIIDYNDPHPGGDAALTPLFEFGGCDPLFQEYFFSILGKAVFHATGREPAAKLRPEKVAVECPRESLPAAPVSFTVAGRIRPDTTLEYEIRDRRNRVIARDTLAVAADAETNGLEPRFPLAPPGLYVVDAWLKRGGLTIDWASAAVTVTGPRYLDAVVFDKDFFGRDEPIAGRVPLAAPLPAGHSLSVSLWDTHERLEQRLELPAGETAFRFAAIPHPLSRTYRVVATVRDGKTVADRQEQWTGLPSDDVEDFQFVAWHAALGGRAARARMQLCKESGLTGYFDMAQYLPRDQLMASADLLARNNLTAWPLCYGIWAWSPKRYGDLLNGPWKEQFRQVYRDRTDAYKRYGTVAYGIDSESTYDADETWDVPAGRDDYRVYLRSRFGDVAAVNAAWGTSFASLDDIGFVSLLEAKTANQPARWMEQIRYKRERFNSAAEVAAGLVREFDPGARVSHDIAIAPTHPGFDMPRMAKVIDAFIQSDLEFFNKRDKDRVASGWWFGTYQNEMSEWTMRTKPWESLFQGGKAIAWWTGEFAFTTDTCEPCLGLRQAAEEIRDIHGGIDRLLMSSDKRIDPILVLYNVESWMASIYYPVGAGWSTALASFVNLCRRTGLDFECVGEDFILERLAFGPQQRVLILPACQAISRAAADKIRKFAADGGLVIADIKPATVDENLRSYAPARPPAGKKPEFVTCPRCKGKKVIHVGGAGDPLGNCPDCGGTGMVAKEAAPVPDTSILADVFDFSKQGIRPVGKGHALFLAGPPAQDQYGALRKLLVDKAGVNGDVAVLDTLGNLRSDLRTFVFDDGPARLVGVLPDKTVADPPGEEFTIKLGRKMHGYNVRTHAYLGHSDAFTAGILPAQAKLFALLPEKIDGLDVGPIEKTYRPGDVVSLPVAAPAGPLADVTLAVRVELLHDGTPVAGQTKKVALKGKITHPVPLALNQAEGEYVLRATEVITGQRHDSRFSVRKR